MQASEMPSEIAEEALLAAVLSEPSAFADVRDTIDADAFRILDHRTIYEAMLAVTERGATPDLTNVNDALTARGHEDTTATLFRIATSAFTPFLVMDYAQRVAHYARRHKVSALLSETFTTFHRDVDADPVETVYALLSQVADLGSVDGDPVLYGDVIEQLQERLTDQLAGTWEDVALPIGLHSVDHRLTGGLRPGELIIVAGRPGSGKTALGMQIVQNIARSKAPALVFSAEMNTLSLMERALSEVSGVPAERVRSKRMDQSDYDRLMRATEIMGRMPVAIDDTSAIKTTQMLARAQRFKRRHGLSLLMFDYMELAGDDMNESEQMRITRISHALKGIAKTLEIPVVALSQLSRKVEERTPPIPRMSDLRMSGAIEADADKILFIYRHDYYAEQGVVDFEQEKQGTADIIIGKQRNGMTGNITVRFDAETMRFMDLDEDPSAKYDMRVGVA